MDKDFKQDFSQCPNCGSKLRFLHELGEELIARKIANPKFNQTYDMRSGGVVDKSTAPKLPIGTILPGFLITTDICMDCGTMYATYIQRQEASLRLQQQPSSTVKDFGDRFAHGHGLS